MSIRASRNSGVERRPSCRDIDEGEQNGGVGVVYAVPLERHATW